MVVVPRLRPHLWLLLMFAVGAAWSVVLSITLWLPMSSLECVVWSVSAPAFLPLAAIWGRLIDAGLIAPLVAKYIYRHPQWLARIALSFSLALGSMIGPAMRAGVPDGIGFLIVGSGLMTIGLLSFVIAYEIRWGHPRWQDGNICPHCAYCLTGLPELSCPECGRRVRPAELRLVDPAQERARTTFAAIAILLSAYITDASLHRIVISTLFAVPASLWWPLELELGYFLDRKPSATNQLVASFLDSTDPDTRLLAADEYLYRPHVRRDGTPYEPARRFGPYRDERWPDATIDDDVLERLRKVAIADPRPDIRIAAAVTLLKFRPEMIRNQLGTLWDEADPTGRVYLLATIRNRHADEFLKDLGDRLREESLDPQLKEIMQRPATP